ncbi:unnamed protein product, partial [Medioppia subpectinata]
MKLQLVNYAKWRCPNADAGHLKNNNGHGENIAQGYGASPDYTTEVDFNSCSAVMDYWASEEKDYDYDGHGQNNRGTVGHFTLVNYAKWRCPNAGAGHLKNNNGHGENIAQGYGASPDYTTEVDFNSCSAVMDYWASEEKDYDYDGHGQNNRVFHRRQEFLWIGSIPALQEKSDHKLMSKDIHYGRHESAFDDFGLQSVNLLRNNITCGVIPYTTDVDTGTWAAFASDQLIDAFIHNDVNLKLLYIYGAVKNGLQFALYTELDLRLDMFFTYKEGPNLSYTAHIPWKNAYFRYIYPYFTLCSAELLGLKVLVPCNPVDVITAEYGPHWYLPKTEWSYDS